MDTQKGYYEGLITELGENQIFLFGSNCEGRHGSGTAKIAREKYGAKYGVGEGRTGQSYALPTVGMNDAPRPSRTLDEIAESVENFYGYATEHPELEFLVAYRNDNYNLCGYSSEQLAACFVARRSLAEVPDNVVFNEGFLALVVSEDKKFEEAAL
jgi:hypothetical protein